MPVYVYSIVGSDHPQNLEDLDGVGDPPAALHTVDSGDLTAVVSDAPEDLRPKRRDLGAHQAVQERLMSDGAVLPLQFGFTAPDGETVRQVLQERAEEFTVRLRELAGCVEYHLKAAQSEESLLRRILLESEEARTLNEQIKGGDSDPNLPLALGELVANEFQARQEQLAQSVLEALRGHAREESLSEPTGQDFLAASFLVEQDGEDDFRTAVDQLAEDLGDDFDLRLHGPLPVYSFV